MGMGGSKGSAAANQGELQRASQVKINKAGGISHQAFIISNSSKELITDGYDMNKSKLGAGTYGSVCKATDKKTKSIRAVKTVKKKDVNPNRLQQEIDIMKLMDHPNIIKLFETFEDKHYVYFVMELCEGGELFDRIIDAGSFTEPQAAQLMQQIVRSIYYMHENSICHRDLKPENFLFHSKDPIETNILKIIDFGLSCKFSKGQVLTTKAGTPYYVAPEVLSGKYDQSSDIWSCGVIMYVLLCGYPPFYGEDDGQVLSKVKSGKYDFPAEDWQNISGDAKDLINAMLVLNTQKRYTAEQAMKHKWIEDKAPNAHAEVHLQSNFVDKLRGFRSANRLKKAALHIIAGQLDEGKIKQLRETFISLDKNNDGTITTQEMRQGLEKAGMSEIPADLKQLMEDVDADGSGNIDYTEFLAATLERRAYLEENLVWTAFRVFDRDNDGKITQKELQQVLDGGDLNDVAGGQRIVEMMKQIDSNGDGVIDFEEFMAMMKSG